MNAKMAILQGQQAVDDTPGHQPENYGDVSEGLKVLNFIGLAADYSSPTVQFNAMCLAHLMPTAHNKIRIFEKIIFYNPDALYVLK